MNKLISRKIKKALLGADLSPRQMKQASRLVNWARDLNIDSDEVANDIITNPDLYKRSQIKQANSYIQLSQKPNALKFNISQEDRDARDLYNRMLEGMNMTNRTVLLDNPDGSLTFTSQTHGINKYGDETWSTIHNSSDNENDTYVSKNGNTGLYNVVGNLGGLHYEAENITLDKMPLSYKQIISNPVVKNKKGNKLISKHK